MPTPEQWGIITSTGELSHEDRFRKMDWLRWRQNPDSSLFSKPIFSEQIGSASWVKSKLATLGVNAKISDHEEIVAGEKISGKIVQIPAHEVMALSARLPSLEQSQIKILTELKLLNAQNTVRAR